MAVPTRLMNNVIVMWRTPSAEELTVYDRVNIYRSDNEAMGYALVTSLPITQTQYADSQKAIDSKDATFYAITFSSSTDDTLISPYELAYKALTPREKRMVFQVRDGLSRFVSDKLADEEVRQYIEQGLNSFNIFSPATDFTIYNLPSTMEPLVLSGSLIWGALQNSLGVGFTDVSYTDNGWQLTTNRADKMGATIDRILKVYNETIRLAKMEFASAGAICGTVQLPFGVGGRIGNILGLLDLIQVPR